MARAMGGVRRCGILQAAVRTAAAISSFPLAAGVQAKAIRDGCGGIQQHRRHCPDKAFALHFGGLIYTVLAGRFARATERVALGQLADMLLGQTARSRYRPPPQRPKSAHVPGLTAMASPACAPTPPYAA